MSENGEIRYLNPIEIETKQAKYCQNDQLEKVLIAYRLSKTCRSIIRQNLVISLGVLILLAIGSLGFALPLPLGVLGHEGSTVIVVMNSLRLLFLRKE